MSTQLKLILNQLNESKNKGINFIKYHDLIDFETVKKLKDFGFKIEANPYNEYIIIYVK